MATIIPFLQENNAFDPGDIAAMSEVLDDVCTTLKLLEGNPAREVIAERIIALARRGERNPTHLRDRVLRESGLASGNGAGDGNGAMDGPAR